MVDKQRVFLLKQGMPEQHGPVVYWMSRDQRVHDNWALLYSVELANSMNVPAYFVFALAPSFPGANLRHYSFLFIGMQEVEKQLKKLGFSFFLLQGEPTKTLPQFLKEKKASVLVSDFDPLRVKLEWKKVISENIQIPHYEVDAHNIVPCRLASQKLEFGAYTLRPKIKRLLLNFLTDFPVIPTLKNKSQAEPTDWQEVMEWLNPDRSISPVQWLKSGGGEAQKILDFFINKGLDGYAHRRNNPLANGQSNLSPYLHFGQISAQRVAIEVSKSSASSDDKSAFLEELIVRRELSDNFCLYNPNYDNPMGFHQWAKESYRLHRDDEREYLYSKSEFELAQTHDELWNAAQMEVVLTGKMHGYMRMYWAKKILEWTNSSEQAMEFAVYLNDKYSLDGRDPNGYAGIAWSIGGVHDRAWSERPVFGKIRYMNYNGCKRKFDVAGYVKKIKGLPKSIN
jgi:deoxyribodipyrimidine photo-lyase